MRCSAAGYDGCVNSCRVCEDEEIRRGLLRLARAGLKGRQRHVCAQRKIWFVRASRPMEQGSPSPEITWSSKVGLTSTWPIMTGMLPGQHV